MGNLLLIVLIIIHVIFCGAVDILRPVHFAEIDPEHLQIKVVIEIVNVPYPQYTITQYALKFKVADDCINLIPLMSPRFYQRRFYLEITHNDKTIIADLEYINRKHFFYLKYSNVFFTKNVTYVLQGTGARPITLGKFGLQMRHYVDHSIRQRDFYFFLNVYPYKFHHFVPNTSTKKMNRVDIAMDFDGYDTIASPTSLDPPYRVFEKVGTEECLILIIRNYKVKRFEQQREFRAIAKGDFQNKFPKHLLPFVNLMNTMFQEHQDFVNTAYPGLSLKIAILPGLNIRPGVLGRDMCLYDEGIITNQAENYKYFFYLCLQHQYFSKYIKPFNTSLYFIDRGLRGLYSFLYLDNYQEKLYDCVAGIIHLEQSSERRSIRLIDYTYDLSENDEQIFGMKSIAVINLLRSTVKKKNQFDRFVQELFWLEGLTFTLFEVYRAIQSVRHIFWLDAEFNINSIFLTWMNSTGYPLIEIKRVLSAVQLNISTTIYPKPYIVFPIELRIPSQKRNEFTWANTYGHYTLQIDGTEDYYLINPEREVMMRVNYDLSNWTKLGKHFSKLEPLSKGTLVSDAYFFFIRGQLPMVYFLRLFGKFKGETSASAWAGIQYVIMDLERHFRFSNLHFQFHVFLNHISRDFYNTLAIHKSGFAVQIACMAGNLKCLKESREKTIEYLNSRNVLHSREQTLCAGMRKMDRDMYHYLMITINKTASYQRILLMAMTCQENPDKIDKFIRWTLAQSETVIPYHLKIKMMINTFMSSDNGGQEFMNYFLYSHEDVYKKFKRRHFHKLISMFSRYLKSKTHYRRIRSVLGIYDIDAEKILQNIIDNQHFIKDFSTEFTNELFEVR